MKEVKTRIPDNVYDNLKSIADNSGRSISDVAREILVRYLSGEQLDEVPVKVQAIKFRVWKKDGTCAYCGEKIKKGEWAYWVIKEMDNGRKIKELWHIDCWEWASDEALGRKAVEKRKLQREINALRKIRDRLADVIIEAQARKKVLEVAQEILEVAKGVEKTYHENMKFLRDFLLQVGETKNFQEVKELVMKTSEEAYFKLDEAVKKLDEVLATLASVKPRKGKKAVKEAWR